jgi:uncharacterized protein YndB with AHSA1/START domain
VTNPGEPTPTSRTPNPVVGLAWKVSAAVALVLVSLLVAGLLLPGTWSAEASSTVEAPPETVYRLVASPRLWDEWAPWPEMEFRYEGPSAGVGALRTWDDPGAGAGSFTITEASPPHLVRYRVELEGGFVTLGTFRLEAVDGATHVTWSEEGDFGRNPLLGWTALSMARRHGDELGRRLRDLGSVARERPAS